MWLRYPEEVETGLLAHYGDAFDIGHWHRLTVNPDTGGPRLSSRRLLALLDELPDDSRFKKAAERDGRRTRSEEVAENVHNELAWLRSSYYAIHGGSEFVYEPHIYRDPIDEKAIAEREAEEAAAAGAHQQEFNAQVGYS